MNIRRNSDGRINDVNKEERDCEFKRKSKSSLKRRADRQNSPIYLGE